MCAWKIDRDYISEGDEPSDVGVHSLGPEISGQTWRFRIKDDDGNVYYGGIFDQHAIDMMQAEEDDGEEHHGSLYEANQWGEYNAGAPWLELHVKDAIHHGLWSEKLKAEHNESDEDWVVIFA
jgi:hypothetical protein